MSFRITGPYPISSTLLSKRRASPQKHYLPVPERAFRSSFSGSLSIEAALALPLFIFFSVCLLHFLLLISLQADIQLHMEEAARDIGKELYITEDSESSLLNAANPLTIRARILDSQLEERIDNSQIRGGISGFSTLLSTYDSDSGILDIIVTYTYDFPYMPAGIADLNFLQKCHSRAWIGREISAGSRNGSTQEEEEGLIVYITPTGSAYHMTPSCPYLDLSIHSVPAQTIDSARNLGGGRYGKCSCAVSGASFYYVTDYGILYHSDLTCSRLKRTVKAVDISEVGGRHRCSKCGGSGE